MHRTEYDHNILFSRELSGGAWFSTANAVTGKIYEWDANVETFFFLTKVNQELTQRNAYLSVSVACFVDKIALFTAKY